MLALFLVVLAQSPTTANLPTTGIALDVLRPKFRGGETTLLSGVAIVSGRTRIGGMRLTFELPIARVETEFIPASTAIGNPYLGLELGGETGLSGSVGARFPLAPDDEAASFTTGIYSDVSRIEQFRFNTLTVQGAVRYRVHNPNGFTFDAGGGPAVWVPTEGGGEAELVLHHDISAGYRGSVLWFGAGFSGWTWMTKGFGGVGERTAHQFNVSIGGARGHVRPAVHLILPIDELYNSNVGYVLGFGIAVDFDH